MLVEEYRTRLRKLVTSVGDYRVRRALPAAWAAPGMHHFKMSVESEASSLMLSPGGRTDPLKKFKKFLSFFNASLFLTPEVSLSSFIGVLLPVSLQKS